MSTSLRTQIEEISSQFASGILNLIRNMSIDELVGEIEGQKPRVRGAAATAAAAVDADAPKPTKKGKRGGGRLARRSPEDIAGMVDSIVELLSKHPDGLRAEVLREKLNIDAKELPRPLAEALSAGKINKSGEKRATTYTVGKGKKAAKKAKAKAAPKKAAKKAKAAPKKAAPKAKAKTKSTKKAAAKAPKADVAESTTESNGAATAE